MSYTTRIDASHIIKVADFGLSENTYSKNYFRQGQDTAVKLPIKWMAPESLNDGVFSEKTDVVSDIIVSVSIAIASSMAQLSPTFAH